MKTKSKASAATTFKERFNARKYIETYYPQLGEIRTLVSIATQIEKSFGTRGRVDINAIARKSGLAHEAIENIAIFDFQKSIVPILLKAFPRGDADILDVGGGPTIYQHIALSLSAKHITHSEFLPTNRQEVSRWLANHPTAYDWDTYFALVRDMLTGDTKLSGMLKRYGKSSTPGVSQHARRVTRLLGLTNVGKLKQHVRTRIDGDVVHADVFKEDLGFGRKVPRTFDIITSNFVVESATGSRKEWGKGMHNILAHVRPGGFFVQTAIRNATWYQVGDKRVPAVSVAEQNIKALCVKEGFTVLQQRILKGSNKKAVGYDGMIFTLAQKR